MKHESDDTANCIWSAWNCLQRVEKRLEELEIREESSLSAYSIGELS